MTAGRQQRLHVAIGPECNNNCLFCMEEDRESRRRTNGALTTTDVQAILEGGRSATEVCFTSGEPSLVEELPDLVARARALGFERVTVTTNGRRLSYSDYCERLVRAGVTRFYVSIHGHDARTHDRLARAPGAFDQTVAGIREVARRGVELHTCTIVARENLASLGSIYAFLRHLGAEQVVFNVLQPNGRADTHFDRLMPRYAEIAAAFADLLANTQETKPPVFLVDIPTCAMQAIRRYHRGWVEPYVHHELDAETERLVERSRTAFDAGRRHKRPECADCACEPDCPGVWKNYLTRYGWEGLEPVERPR